jgi:hypothetical protein
MWEENPTLFKHFQTLEIGWNNGNGQHLVSNILIYIIQPITKKKHKIALSMTMLMTTLVNHISGFKSLT